MTEVSRQVWDHSRVERERRAAPGKWKAAAKCRSRHVHPPGFGVRRCFAAFLAASAGCSELLEQAFRCERSTKRCRSTRSVSSRSIAKADPRRCRAFGGASCFRQVYFPPYFSRYTLLPVSSLNRIEPSGAWVQSVGRPRLSVPPLRKLTTFSSPYGWPSSNMIREIE